MQSGTYYYRVRAENSLGSSSFTSAVSAIVSSVLSVDIKPDEFYLAQNYPNPCNPGTTISFSLPERSRAVLSIYNQLGQKVAELFNEEKPAGLNSIAWNAGNLSSGVYFYELKTEKSRAVKKLLLMK